MVVVWTERAKKRLRSVYNYYNEAAGRRSAERIVHRIINKTERLAKQPRMGVTAMSLEQNIRSMVVHKHYKVLYNIENEIIYVNSVFDCRQNPEKMKGEVEK